MKKNEDFKTLIVVQVPHQRKVFAAAIESLAQLQELAGNSVGENYEFPGHWEKTNDDPDDPGDWIDDSTEDDLREAIRHDMHITYFVDEDDYKAGWNPGSHHQAAAARAAVERIALELGWRVEDEDDDLDQAD